MTIDQHPLAYLLGLEGLALLRAFAGEHDRAFAERRIAAIRDLLDGPAAQEPWTVLPAITTEEGYRRWAPTYDEPGNGLIDVEGPIVRAMVEELPSGVAVDVACGTGRHTAFLVERGHRVVAVDSSPEMLDVARRRSPEAMFVRADLLELPLPDGAADLVVCALALAHLDDVAGAMRELARVVRPGGQVIVSDAHGLAGGFRPPVVMEGGALPHVNRRTGDHLRAALAAGLEVLAYEEPAVDRAETVNVDRGALLVEGPPNIWLLHAWDPEATAAAFADQPAARIWRFSQPGR